MQAYPDASIRLAAMRILQGLGVHVYCALCGSQIDYQNLEPPEICFGGDTPEDAHMKCAQEQ